MSEKGGVSRREGEALFFILYRWPSARHTHTDTTSLANRSLTTAAWREREEGKGGREGRERERERKN